MTTEVRDVASTAVGDTFRVFVGECGPAPRETLIVADGTGLFGLAVDTIRLMQIPALVPPMLVVGIGYPTAAVLADTVGIRVRDLTPTQVTGFDRSGGADAFGSFIADELMPGSPIVTQARPSGRPSSATRSADCSGRT